MRWVSLTRLNETHFAGDPVSIRTLRNWAVTGVIPARKFGKLWRVDLDAMDGDRVVTERKAQAADIVARILAEKEGDRASVDS